MEYCSRHRINWNIQGDLFTPGKSKSAKSTNFVKKRRHNKSSHSCFTKIRNITIHMFIDKETTFEAL